jgi:hypothetical protein
MNLIPKDPTKRVWLGFLAAFVVPAIIAIWTLLFEAIPPRDLTAARMFITKRRILQYAQLHGSLPPNLSVLPPMPSNYDASTSDAWGRPMDYSVDSAGNVTLRSLGADKAPGGTADNADMIAIFVTHDWHGAWADPAIPWAKDPSKP